MSYQPLISKIRCHNPNKSSARYANRANLHYIATRDGVDLSQLNEEALEDSYFKYASEDIYTRYMSERPRSHGLFGNIDTTDLKKIEQTVYQISKTGQNVYRGIVSLGERDAQALGYLDSSTWYAQMQSVMPDIASTLGINSTNFTWIGAYHAEPGHPHVHYQIWDNTERIRSSYIHTSVQKQCRKILESSFFNDEYEKSLQAIFEAERGELYKSKNESRESITDYFKDIMKLQHVPGMLPARLPQRFTLKEAEKLTFMMEKLQGILPDTGRMYYKFMPPSVKNEIDKISDFIFKRPEIKAALSGYLTAADQIHQIDHPGQSDITRKLAKKDIYRRTGNIILKYVFPSEPSEKPFSLDETDSQEPVSHPSDGTLLSLAKVYLSEPVQNLDAAFNILSELTEAGSVEAQYLLGQIRLSGSYCGKPIEQSQDIPKAIELLQAASAQGNQYAQYTLGKIYLYGQYSVPKDVSSGKQMLQASAEQGNKYAQNTLSHHEWMHSPLYLLSNLLYQSLYYSMMQRMHQKQQELTDRKTAISKQVQKEQNKQEEISHL